MTEECMTEISNAVAEAINQENFDSLEDDVREILEDAGIARESWADILEKSWITCWIASLPGCLPNSTAVFPMDADPETIREDILSWLEDDPALEDDDGAWEEIRGQVANLDLTGDSLDTPGGDIIEVFRASCADVLRDNGCYPE